MPSLGPNTAATLFGAQGYQGPQGNQSGLQGYQGNQGNQGNQSGVQGNQGYQGNQGSLGGLEYYYDASSTSPGITSNGSLRFNNASMASATQLYINVTDLGGNNNTNFINSWNFYYVTSYLLLQNSSGTENIVLSISTPVNNTTYFTFNVIYVSGSAPVSANGTMIVSWITPGPQGHQGNQGNMGFSGLPGNQGNQGNQSGVQGYQGNQGNQGNQGAGSQGNQGNQGLQVYYTLQGNQVALANTLQNISGLQFTAVAGAQYHVVAGMNLYNPSTSSSCGFAVSSSGSSPNVQGSIIGTTSGPTASTLNPLSGSGVQNTSSYMTAATNIQGTVHIDTFVVAGTGSPIIAIQGVAITTGATWVKYGYMVITRVD